MGWGWFVIGTAAATFGAAVIIANSPWITPKRPPFSIARLKKATLVYLDGSDRVVKGEDLWMKNGAVIMAVRRVG